MNYEGDLVVCSRCGAELGYVYTSPKGRPKRAYCPACFRYLMYLMTGEEEEL